MQSDFDADGDGFYTFDEFTQAITAAYPTYVWPEHYRIALETLISDIDAISGPDDRFQAGGEYTIIGFPHMCAWEYTWLDAYREGDQALMATSLDQLRTTVLDNPMFYLIRDNLENIYDRAELGDPALMQQHVDSRCDRADLTAFSTTPATPAAHTERGRR